MARDALRGYLQLVSGLGELTRAKATEAADALLSLSSWVSTPVATQVASLADEIMAAASANRDSLTALVRAEVESALAHALAAPGGELDRARLAMVRLSRELEEVRGQVLGSPTLRTVTGSGSAAIAAMGAQLGLGGRPDVVEPSRTDGREPEQRPTQGATGSPGSTRSSRGEGARAATTAPAKRSAPARSAVPRKRVTKTAAAASRATPTRKTAVKKAAPAKKTAAKKTTVKKTTAKKTTAKKTTPAKKAAAKKAGARKATPARKTTAAKRTPATRTTGRQIPGAT